MQQQPQILTMNKTIIIVEVLQSSSVPHSVPIQHPLGQSVAIHEYFFLLLGANV